MLSIGKARHPAYYIDLAARDYYVDGGEPPGEWYGGGADSLGLTGTVIRRHFLDLLAGFSPTGKKLRRNAGTKHKKKDRPGFDLTFTPPKSVSVLWALAPRRLRRAILRAHRRAVLRVVRHIEEELAFIRKGKGGHERLRARIFAALFEHGTSRLDDPNPHTHVVLANIGLAGQESGALDASLLYRSKMFLGALYRIELAYFLRRTVRVAFRRVRQWFEIRGIAQRVLNHFSKRREELLAEQRRTGNRGARSAEAAANSTRRPKLHRPRRELFREWRAQAEELGLTRKQIVARFGRDPLTDPDEIAVETSLDGNARRLQRTIAKAIKKLSTRQATFTEHGVIRLIASRAIKLDLSVDQVLRTTRRYLDANTDVIYLGTHDNQRRYATRKTIELESQLLDSAETLKRAAAPKVSQKVRSKVLARGPDINDEQWRAYLHLIDGPGRIKMLSGLPGTGKTRILDLCRDAWESSGYRVIGAAIAGRAARNLEAKSGITSHTVERVTRDLEATIWHDTWHHYQQFKRLAAGKRTFAISRLKLDKKTILVIDEAAMLDTGTAAKIFKQVEQARATLVLAGDRNQIPPIAMGAPYAALEQLAGTADLEIIRRLRQHEDVEALRTLLMGDPEATLENYRSRGLLHVAETRHDAVQQLLQDWQQAGGLLRPQEHFILVATNEDRQTINRHCHELRRQAGLHTSDEFTHRKQQFAAGDQIMFLKNHAGLDVHNGDLGTIVAYDEDGRWLTVKTAEGKEIRFSAKHYADFTLGYAGTVHKLQGSDVKHSYWLADTTLLSKELAYTALSRHEESIRIYADRIDAGEKLQHLLQTLRQSSREPLASELLETHQAALDELPPRPQLLESEHPPSVERALWRLDQVLAARQVDEPSHASDEQQTLDHELVPDHDPTLALRHSPEKIRHEP